MRRPKKSPVKILVVEDDADILNALNIALGSMGFDVDVLLNGKSILQNRFVRPDLFIVDKRLPDVDGLEICRYLKSESNYEKVPVIIISASNKMRKKAMECGASCFLEKPFAMQELMKAVRHFLRIPERADRSHKNGWR